MVNNSIPIYKIPTMKERLTEQEKLNIAEKLRISRDGLYTSKGVFNDAEWQKRVREAQRRNLKKLVAIVAIIGVVGLVAIAVLVNMSINLQQ